MKQPKASTLSTSGRALHVGKNRTAKRAAAKSLGSKGGKNRAKKLTREELSAIGRKGGLARHGLTESESTPAAD